MVVTALAAVAALLMLLSAFTTVVSVDVASGSCEVLNDTNPELAEQCDQSGLDRHSVVFPLLAVAVLVMGFGAGLGRSRAGGRGSGGVRSGGARDRAAQRPARIAARPG